MNYTITATNQPNIATVKAQPNGQNEIDIVNNENRIDELTNDMMFFLQNCGYAVLNAEPLQEKGSFLVEAIKEPKGIGF